MIPAMGAALGDTPVVLLHGARQVGKSTLARGAELLSGGAHRYITLDDAAALSAATNDPGGFIDGLDGPVVIDEVQRAPELFRAIKAAVDRKRTAGRFLLTGSANVMLLPRVSESLAGRIEIITLWPLSQGEMEGRRESFIDAAFAKKMPAFSAKGESDLMERVLRGGYPEPAARLEARRAAWFSSYVTTILLRDVREIANIEGLTNLPRMLSLVASRSAGLLNHADLSRSLETPLTTLRRYMTLLEATFLVAPLPAWSTNLGLRLTKSPKMHLVDTGLAAHLMGVTRDSLASNPNPYGPLVESFVVNELRKSAGWSEERVSFFHFRTLAGREVDVVMENAAGEVVGVEVKAGATVGADDFKGLRALEEIARKKFRRGIVVYDGRETVGFGGGMVAVPVGAVWGL